MRNKAGRPPLQWIYLRARCITSCVNELKFAVLSLSAIGILAGCVSIKRPEGSQSFAKTAEVFVASHFRVRPIEAVALGWHEYDGKFFVPSKHALEAEEARLLRFSQLFENFASSKLTPAEDYDRRLFQSAIAGQLWALQRQQIYQKNPLFYAGGLWYAAGLDASPYLTRDFKPLPDRIADITAILRFAPAFFQAGRQNLETVLPRVYVEAAIDSAEGSASFLENDVSKAVSTLTNAAIQADFRKAGAVAAAAFRDFAKWLKNERLPLANNEFALGRAAFVAMLQTQMIDLAPEKLLEIGLRELKAEQARFAAAAAIIDPKQKPIDVFKSLQREHPTADRLLPETRDRLAAIRRFVSESNIVTVPGMAGPRVRETLPPFRSSIFASMDTPGPFESKALDACYYVTPVEPHWTPQQAEEWLGAFNFYAIDITSIHEAFPGHYTQFMVLNSSPASRAAKIFTSYPFTEGWAHYAEQMMVDQGFGGPASPANPSREEQIRAAKYRLEQSDQALVRLCRLCCSIQLHCQGMTLEQAVQFFMANSYYEAKPARAEALRGTYDPGYLYYTLGKLMLLKLRIDWLGQEGAVFSLQRFHDEVLRHGAPPIPLLREIMLRDSKLWPEIL